VTHGTSRGRPPTERNSRASKQGRRYLPSVAGCYEPTATARQLVRQRFSRAAAGWAVRRREHARDVPVVAEEGGPGGGPFLPPAWLPPGSPGAGWCSWGTMPGGQARMSGTPPPRRSTRRSHSRLTARPAATPAGHWRWSGGDAPSARAAALASSAALPRPPGDPAHPARGGQRPPTSMGTSTPPSFPTREGCVPLAALAEGICPAQRPFGGVVRPRRAVRFARLMQRPGRDLGGPAARAAYGGNLSLTWLPPRVVRRVPDRPAPQRPRRALGESRVDRPNPADRITLLG
jgi:hypothetical protein